MIRPRARSIPAASSVSSLVASPSTARKPSARARSSDLGQHVDHHHVLAVVAELSRDGRAHPAVSAQDEVPAQRLDRPCHPSRLPFSAGGPEDQRFRHHADEAEEEPHAHDREEHGPHVSGRAERAYLAEPDRGDRDDGHVERVEQRPPLDRHEACRAERGDGDHGSQPDADVRRPEPRRDQGSPAEGRGRVRMTAHRGDSTVRRPALRPRSTRRPWRAARAGPGPSAAPRDS